MAADKTEADKLRQQIAFLTDLIQSAKTSRNIPGHAANQSSHHTLPRGRSQYRSKNQSFGSQSALVSAVPQSDTHGQKPHHQSTATMATRTRSLPSTSYLTSITHHAHMQQPAAKQRSQNDNETSRLRSLGSAKVALEKSSVHSPVIEYDKSVTDNKMSISSAVTEKQVRKQVNRTVVRCLPEAVKEKSCPQDTQDVSHGKQGLPAAKHVEEQCILTNKKKQLHSKDLDVVKKKGSNASVTSVQTNTLSSQGAHFLRNANFQNSRFKKHICDTEQLKSNPKQTPECANYLPLDSLSADSSKRTVLAPTSTQLAAQHNSRRVVQSAQPNKLPGAEGAQSRTVLAPARGPQSPSHVSLQASSSQSPTRNIQRPASSLVTRPQRQQKVAALLAELHKTEAKINNLKKSISVSPKKAVASQKSYVTRSKMLPQTSGPSRQSNVASSSFNKQDKVWIRSSKQEISHRRKSSASSGELFNKQLFNNKAATSEMPISSDTRSQKIKTHKILSSTIVNNRFKLRKINVEVNKSAKPNTPLKTFLPSREQLRFHRDTGASQSGQVSVRLATARSASKRQHAARGIVGKYKLQKATPVKASRSYSYRKDESYSHHTDRPYSHRARKHYSHHGYQYLSTRGGYGNTSDPRFYKSAKYGRGYHKTRGHYYAQMYIPRYLKQSDFGFAYKFYPFWKSSRGFYRQSRPYWAPVSCRKPWQTAWPQKHYGKGKASFYSKNKQWLSWKQQMPAAATKTVLRKRVHLLQRTRSTQSKLKLDRRTQTGAPAPSTRLVLINGLLYKSSSRRLTKTASPARSSAATAAAPSTLHATSQPSTTRKSGKAVVVKKLNPNAMKTISVRGVKFRMDASGHSLHRLDQVSSPSKQLHTKRRKHEVKRVDIGGVTYIQTKPGTLVRSATQRTRAVASRVKSRSIAAASGSFKKDNTKSIDGFCIFYNKFGRCKLGPRCPYKHDPNKVAVCTRFLRGTCKVANCPFSHKMAKEKMPVCLYFLRGVCNRDDCPYRHVKVNKNADVCRDFLNGFCPKGEQCLKQHTLVCPVFSQTGACPRGTKCPMLHTKKKVRKQDPDKKKRSISASTQSASTSLHAGHKRAAQEAHLDDDVATGDSPSPAKMAKLPAFISLSSISSVEATSVTAVSPAAQGTSVGPEGRAPKLQIRPRF